MKERHEEKKETKELTLPWPPVMTKTISVAKDYLSEVVQPILDVILSYLLLSEKFSFGSVNKRYRNILLKYLVKSTEAVKKVSYHVYLRSFGSYGGSNMVKGRDVSSRFIF